MAKTRFDLTFLRREQRFDPEQAIRAAQYYLEELRRALSAGHFRQAVRPAEMFAAFVRIAAIAEERDAEMNAAPTVILIEDGLGG